MALALIAVGLSTPSTPAADPPLQLAAAPSATTIPDDPVTTSSPAPASATVTTTPNPAPPKPAAPVAPAVRDPQDTPTATAGLPSLLEVAQAEVGGPETRYTTGWGFSKGFWCAKFISWVLAHAGIALREDGPADFRFVVEQVDGPVPGDLVFIDLVPEQKTGHPTHIGIVESLNADGSVVTIEGNADASGLVIRRLRMPAEIISFGRAPAPTSATVIPAPEVGPGADCIWIEIGKPWLCDDWVM